MQTVNTQTFVTLLVNQQLALNDDVQISAAELFALMQENIKLAKIKNEAVLQNDEELVNLRKQVNELKHEKLSFLKYRDELKGRLGNVVEQERIQRTRANELQKQVDELKKQQPIVKVNYTKGDLLDYVN